MRLIVNIKEKAFVHDNPSYMRMVLEKFEGKSVSLEITPLRGKVSSKLRGYYFGVVIPTVKHTIPEWRDISDDNLHEILKKLFNGFNFFNPITKRTERIGRGTMNNERDTARAMEFIDSIATWLANEYRVNLPDPKEYKDLRDSAQLK